MSFETIPLQMNLTYSLKEKWQIIFNFNWIFLFFQFTRDQIFTTLHNREKKKKSTFPILLAILVWRRRMGIKDSLRTTSYYPVISRNACNHHQYQVNYFYLLYSKQIAILSVRLGNQDEVFFSTNGKSCFQREAFTILF